MRDFLFYNASYGELRGLERLTIPFRRLARYLLRPLFHRQVELFRAADEDLRALTHSHQELTEQVAELFPWLAELQATLAGIHTRLDAHQSALETVRAELTATRAAAQSAQQTTRLEGLEEDQLALARRLAVLEDELVLLQKNRLAATTWDRGVDPSEASNGPERRQCA